MNDDDLLTVVREEFSPVRMTIPAGAIMARGSARRRLRRGQIGAAALAVALGAGLGVPALAAGGGTTSPSATSRTVLAAWTVAKQPDGAINVTVRELLDLPALQAKLKEDGARVAVGIGKIILEPSGGIVIGPSSVTPSAGCQVGPTNPAPVPTALTFHNEGKSSVFIVIAPAKIPAGDMVRIAITKGGSWGTPGDPSEPAVFSLLVRDSPHCGF